MQERPMTMTRETKVGLVLCLSFLCLVGIVLGTKLRGDGAGEDEQTFEEPIPAPQPTGSRPRDLSPPAHIPAQPSGSSGPGLIQTAAVQDAQPVPPPTSATNAAQNDNQNVGPKPPGEGLAIFSSDNQDRSNSPSASASDLPPPPQRESSSTNDGSEPLNDSADVVLLPFFGPVKLPLISGDLAEESLPSNGSGPPDIPPPGASSSLATGAGSQPTAAKEKPDGTVKPAPGPIDDVPPPTTTSSAASAAASAS